MDLLVLASESHTLDGCDRVALCGDQIIVQGKPVTGYPEGTRLRLPPGEVLIGISVQTFLEAAHNLERQIGHS